MLPHAFTVEIPGWQFFGRDLAAVEDLKAAQQAELPEIRREVAKDAGSY